MAVMQNSIIFGGINSADFGIYIGGEGTFNAPKRAVEMVTVPGRNGDIAIDQGHYENIEVTYSAFNYEEDLATFAKQLSDFRNAIVSQVGYQRLTDTFHPDEYRMAIYTEGLEIDPIKYNTASEFELKFNCKPQRWLTSGEVPVTIGEWGATQEASGEIVTIESEGGEIAKSLMVELEPIQAGSGEPSPDNVRPISGRTSVETTRTGKNLLTYTETHRTISGVSIDISADGVLHAYGTATAGLWVAVGEFEAKSGKTYFYGNLPRGMSTTTYFVTRYGSTGNTYEDSEYTFANDTNAVPRFYVRKDVTLDVTFKLVVADADTAQTYTTALGRTVYGGTLDVVSGVLTVDRARVDLGSLTYTYQHSTTRNDFYVTISDAIEPIAGGDTKAVCSCYERMPFSSMQNGGFCISDYDRNPVDKLLLFRNTQYTSADDFKASMSGQTLVYTLETPQTYQLTPQQVTLLVGENHVWSDGAITMQYGTNPNSLWNPTQYDAGPLLITDGYGTISFNGYDIEITHVPVGWVTLVNRGEKYLTTALPNASGQYSVKWNSELLQRGDTINVASQSDRAHKITFNISNLISLDTYTYSNSNPDAIDESVLEFAFDNVSFTAGTARTITNTLTVTPTGSGSSASWTGSIRYDGDSTVTFSISKSSTDTFRFEGEGYVEWSNIESKSTAQAFGRPTYIDCELGEAYKIENDEIISLNKYLDLGSDLPKLSPGANDVTTDSTITELQVVPNWWKL